jgi:plasmid stabilization system protein ParE
MALRRSPEAEEADAMLARSPLRAPVPRRECREAERERDERTPPHSITASASARSAGGTVRVEAPYIVVYRVHEARDEIVVLAIFHGAQNR